MELSSLVSRQIPYLSGGAGVNTRSSQPLFPGDVNFPGRKAFGASRLRSRRALNSGFDDNSWHVEYYYYNSSGSTSAAGNNKKVKEIKKKLKGVPDTNDIDGVDTTDDAGSGTELEIDVGTGAAGIGVDTGAAAIEVDFGASLDLEVDLGMLSEEVEIDTGS